MIAIYRSHQSKSSAAFGGGDGLPAAAARAAATCGWMLCTIRGVRYHRKNMAKTMPSRRHVAAAVKAPAHTGWLITKRPSPLLLSRNRLVGVDGFSGS